MMLVTSIWMYVTVGVYLVKHAVAVMISRHDYCLSCCVS